MTRIEFGYGKGTMTVDIPEKNLIASLRPRSVTHNVVGEDVIREALSHRHRYPGKHCPSRAKSRDHHQ